MLPEWVQWVIGIATLVSTFAGLTALYLALRNRGLINDIEQNIGPTQQGFNVGGNIQTINIHPPVPVGGPPQKLLGLRTQASGGPGLTSGSSGGQKPST